MLSLEEVEKEIEKAENYLKSCNNKINKNEIFLSNEFIKGTF